MKNILTLILCITASLPAGAKHLFSEKTYQKYFCSVNNGYIEYILPDRTRVDCLTDTYAIEVDFANKWAEAIGQSLYYSNETGKQAGILLILVHS